jgi:hypothetical protein
MQKKENDIVELLTSMDNGGRRSGGERRNYSYSLHIPERRKGKDRRESDDRRKFHRIKNSAQP